MTPEEFLAQAAPAADELRERLLSFMVHEIRNPLASALWSAEMLARHPSGDNRKDRLSQLAARSVRRLRVLIEDMFALERLPRVPPAGEVGLEAAIDRALSPHDLDPEGIAAEKGPVPQGLVVPLDPLLLDRLLQACVRRAVHAGSGGRIALGFEAQGDRVRVSITRSEASRDEVDPPLLTPGGSEGEGTTFTMFLARVAAQRLGVPLEVEESPDGVVLRLTLPVKQG